MGIFIIGLILFDNLDIFNTVFHFAEAIPRFQFWCENCAQYLWTVYLCFQLYDPRAIAISYIVLPPQCDEFVREMTQGGQIHTVK